MFLKSTTTAAAMTLLVGLGGWTAAPGATAQPLNVIFYGNSFTFGAGSTRSVNDLFRDIATAAGQDTPLVSSAAVSGQDLEWHVNNNTSPIFTTIPPSLDWDHIVMQEHSTKLTRAYTGSPAFPASVEESKTTAVQLLNAAQQRSAGVMPVLYQTWARGPGHAFYTGTNPQFPGGPSEMQAEVRDGYDQLKAALDADLGNDATLIAPVGDAWESINYDRLHSGDLWHAQNRGTLLAALTIYGTIYGDLTSDIDLSAILTSLNLTAQDGVELTAAADSVVPEPATLGLLGASGLLMLRRRAA